MADLTCGEGGSTGAEVVTRINELTRRDPQCAVGVTITLSQTIGDVFEPLASANNVVAEISGLTADVTGNIPTLKNEAGNLSIAKITAGLNLEFSGELALQLYISVDEGVTYTPAFPTDWNLEGRGTGKPVSLFWQVGTAMPLNARLQMWGKNVGVGNLDLLILNTTFGLESSIIEIIS